MEREGFDLTHVSSGLATNGMITKNIYGKKMKLRIHNTAIIIALLLSFGKINLNAQSNEVIVYKTIDTLSLEMEIVYPKNFENKKNLTAIVFFFGGGWVGGTRSQFIKHAEYFANLDIVSFLVDYRVKKHT